MRDRLTLRRAASAAAAASVSVTASRANCLIAILASCHADPRVWGTQGGRSELSHYEPQTSSNSQLAAQEATY